MKTPQADINIPQVRLPKGGGAIKGIGETFESSPFTGTGSFAIPIMTPPARGLEPDLKLNYSSGASQGIFGLGFSLSVPHITRRTEKRLPDYSELDEFVFSDAEYLVRALQQRESGWVLDEESRDEFDQGIRIAYRVRRYRPRTEGQFLRIERWTRIDDGDEHWRVITPDQITSVYGRSPTARIVHPDHPLQVFSWLLEQTEDDRGNRIQYHYKREDGVGIAPRLNEGDRVQTAQTYLHKIQYGNFSRGSYAFSIVLDYGEYDLNNPTTLTTRPTRSWGQRPDPFSDYRAGFEVRTHRLCRNILIFHHFPEELATPDCLERAIHLTYRESPVLTMLTSVQYVGYLRQPSGTYERQPLPPLTFQYSDFDATQSSFQPLLREPSHPLENRFDGGSGYQLLDLYGEGISGLLYDQHGITLYWRAQGNGSYGDAHAPAAFPVERNQPAPVYALSDGLYTRATLRTPGRSGLYERVDEHTWTSFQPYGRSPIDYGNPVAEYTDVTGDGSADLLVFEENRVKVYPSAGRDGHGGAMVVGRSPDLPLSPSAAATEKLMFADMGGDGLSDRVRVRNGEVVYWPNLGYGKFGAKVSMDGAPHFGEGMDAARIFLVDIDGSGTSDLVYVDSRYVWVYYNQSGNGFSSPIRIPLPANYSSLSQIQFADVLGNGTACLVFTQGGVATSQQFYDFTGGVKPHLLTEIDNHMGAINRIYYAPSTYFYLADRQANRPWLTRLPFPVQVVERIEQVDLIARSRRVSRFAYHHGAYEFREREFAGFGLVEQWDTETFEQFHQLGASQNAPDPADADFHVPPIYTKTWYHTGTAAHQGLSHQFAAEYYTQQAFLEDSGFESLADPDSVQEAHRALRGRILRQEVYGLDGAASERHPYTVQEQNYTLRLMQPAEGTPASVYMALPRAAITYHYERNPSDPRIMHRFYLRHDDYGQLTHSAEVAYARSASPEHPDQGRTQGKYTVEDYIHLTQDAYRLGIPAQTQVFELAELPNAPLGWDQFKSTYPNPEQTAVDFDQSSTGARLMSWKRYRYWNEEQTEVLPPGQAGSRALLHHAETAMYPQDGVERLIQPTETSNIADKLLSLDADGGAWVTIRRDRENEQRFYYFDPGIQATYGRRDQFYQVEQYADQFGTVTQVGYDAHRLLMVRTETRLNDGQSLVQTVQPDYHTLQPKRGEDINHNITEYLYDPLGNLRVMSHYGQEGDRLRGDRPLSDYRILEEWRGDRLLVNPHAYLQNATQCFFYDVMAWEQQGQPVYALTLQREIYTSDLDNQPESPLQISLTYFDGLGRDVQQKQRAEGGTALALNGAGTATEVRADQRWITTGWSVYNNKGAVVKQFEPFYSNTPNYQADPALTYHGVATVRHYDPLGRVRRLDLPTGYITRTEYGAWDERYYDANDALPDSPFYRSQSRAEQTQLDRRFGEYFGTFTRRGFDGWGRQILQQHQVSRESEPFTTLAWLDLLGNPLKLQDPRFASLAPREEEGEIFNARITYDMEGRLLRLESGDQGTHLRLHNAGGDEIQRWDSRGFRISTEYDALSRPTAVWVEHEGRRYQAERIEYGETIDPDGDRNLRGQVLNRYDQAGGTQFSQYSIDGDWRESRRRFCRQYRTAPDWSNNPPLEAEPFITQRFRDALGRLERLQLPDGQMVQQAYHTSGRVRSLQFRETNNNQLQAIVSNIRYNARSQREEVGYGNGVTTTYRYDPNTFYLTRLLSQRQQDSPILQDIQYSYDPVGNLAEIVDHSHRTVFGDNNVVAPRQTYRYDALYRLVRATGREHPGLHRTPRHSGLTDDASFLPLPHVNNVQALQNYTRNYTYDSAGNLTRIQHVARGTAFTRNILISDTSNRGILQQENTRSADLEDAYDPNGNLVQADHLREMRWNYRNQLVSVDVIRHNGGNSDSEYYVYDGAGRRTRKVYERQIDGQIEIEETLYIGDYEVYRIRRGNQVRQERTSTHLTLDQEKIATVYRWTVRRQNDPNRQVRYQLSNHQGSVALELDDEAKIVTYEEYYPYGGTALIASRGDREVKRKVYRYGGRERDAVSQFYDYGSRYYVPWLGRWLSPDPAGFGDGLNLYQFVRDNPIGYVDDTGTTSRRIINSASRGSGTSASSSSSNLNAPSISGSQFLNVGRRVKRRPRLPSEWLNPAAASGGGQGAPPGNSGSSPGNAASGGTGASLPSVSNQPLAVRGRSRANAVSGAVAAQHASIASGAVGNQSSAQPGSSAGSSAASATQIKFSVTLEDGDMATATRIAAGILVALMLLKQQGGQSANSAPANRSDSVSTRSQSRSSSVSSVASDASSDSSDGDSSSVSRRSSLDDDSFSFAESESFDDDDDDDRGDDGYDADDESDDFSNDEDDFDGDRIADSSAEASSQDDDRDTPSGGSSSATQVETRRRRHTA